MEKRVGKIELVVSSIFIIYLGGLWWSLINGETFLFVDYFNLAIHEAGHLLFFWGGPVISTWGGTILQLLIPILCFGYFLIVRKEMFSSGICGYWVGENLVNIGIYVADAEKQLLPLVGGGEHDWAYLLSRAGMLSLAEIFGGWVKMGGLFTMFLFLIWMAVVILRQTRPTSNYT